MAWAQGITAIEVVPDLGATPARVKHNTGVIQVSAKHFKVLTPWQRKFVLLHEMGHIKAQTGDEVKADEWAEKQYLDMGGPPDESLSVLTKLLNNQNPQHNWRIYLQMQRIARYEQDHQ
ncbi:hypothetical protein HQ865_01200 [Mucilaginibacter mali]|uniref:IrrE N-terminal-like domain-containing protein n=1 Tax=Mucilaginibacter mali TaxID=2740462 RepID=A0A7D4Q5B6_9SPHI|nr:hypothetical protein [Mucilaginibacter mali]QKJ28431.1 hypothetical protein HQ865_01200 [Mucilaginibacter mali]